MARGGRRTVARRLAVVADMEGSSITRTRSSDSFYLPREMAMSNVTVTPGSNIFGYQEIGHELPM
uniref:Uncharacterized protein n=1 Tax=Hyaloperonospora arabidopsidis (strain Emoy2) TaxID=559515 RepID=M4BEF4_HYAAE